MARILLMQLNVWTNHVKHTGYRTLLAIFCAIREGVYKDTVTEIRQLYSVGSAAAAADLKKTLHAFTTAGIFKPGENRSLKTLVSYTGILTFDIDNLMPGQVQETMERIKAIPYTLMAFISPSGTGIKFFTVVDSNLEHHKLAYQQVCNYYSDELGITLDEKTNDVCRLCYVSYDPNAYLNKEAKVFHIIIPELQPVVFESDNKDCVLRKKFEYIAYKVGKTNVFKKENRNNYVYNFACLANRLGMEQNTLKNHLLTKYVEPDFSMNEITTTIKSAYQNNKAEHATYNYPDFVYSNKDDMPPVEQKETDNTPLELDSPYISEFVKENLPAFIKDILVRLHGREQDVFIIGVLTALSGCIAASGLYRNKRYHASLFSFISAPPASGKGVLNYSMQLVLPLHRMLREKSEEDARIYEAALEEYRQRKNAGEKSLEKPEKPLYKTILVPANSSSSQLIEHLQHNGEQGLMIETEADTMVKTLESDFGNYSDLLRKAAEHEPISMRRKTDKQYIEMFNPKLAACLSGTPKQLSKLVTSVENGLFSRFAYYVFSGIPQWQDVTPTLRNEVPLTDFVDSIGKQIATKLMHQRENPLQFTLTKQQWAILNTVFTSRVTEFSCFVGEEASANIFRLAVSTFRIAMLLTVLRGIEASSYEKQAVCSDLDFEIAMSLSDTFYKHLIYAFKVITNGNEVLNKTLKTLYNLLPEQFDRKACLDIAKKNGMTAHERTLDKYLKRLVDYKFLVKYDYNTYSKKPLAA